MNKFYVNESDKLEILKKHRELLKEQATVPAEEADLKTLHDLVKSGCLKQGTIYRNTDTKKYFYRAKNKSGKEIDFFPDMTFKYVDGSESGKWKCPELKSQIAPIEDKSSRQRNEMLAYYKTSDGGGWKEESEVPAQDFDKYAKEHVPNSEKFWSPNGIELYKERKEIAAAAETIRTNAKTIKTDRSIDKNECKRQLESYWTLFSKHLSDNPDPEQKNVVQACINQHYGEWRNKFDDISDALTGIKPSFGSDRGPVTKSTWRLLPKSYQKF
jgi:hypothetical protein